MLSEVARDMSIGDCTAFANEQVGNRDPHFDGPVGVGSKYEKSGSALNRKISSRHTMNCNRGGI